MKPVRISPPASEEFTEAVRWYEGKRVGLGAEFYDAVIRTVDLVHQHPEIGTASQGSLTHRRFLVGRFPYEIVYRERATGASLAGISTAKHRKLQQARSRSTTAAIRETIPGAASNSSRTPVGSPLTLRATRARPGRRCSAQVRSSSAERVHATGGVVMSSKCTRPISHLRRNAASTC